MADIDVDVPSLMLINGPQGSGKSRLITYLMHKLRKKFDYGIIFTNTFFDSDPFPFIKPEYIHPEYDEEVLENLMNKQAKLIEKGIIKEAFVIMDDCLDDPGEFKSAALKKLSTQCRHYHITLIMSTQYCNALPSRM